MTSAEPPNPWFSTINFNETFFRRNTVSITLAYADATYLKRVGVATSVASTTTFTGDITAPSFLGNYRTTNTGVNATHYLNFSDSSSTGVGAIQKTAGLSVNPSTNIISASAYTIGTTPATSNVASQFGQVGLVKLQTITKSITGSASAVNFNLANVFTSAYRNYRIELMPTTQLAFSAYPSYALAGFLGTGTQPTTGALYGYEMTSSSTTVVSPVYTAGGAVLATTPLVFSVSSFVNKQVIFEIQNVGFANTTGNLITLSSKSFYSNPGIQGASDRNILCSSPSGTTITGLTIQQGALSVGNDMTIQAIIYGYNQL